MPTLDELRAQLGQVDLDLLRLVARRQQLAQRIGQEKRALGLATRDFRQEREVLDRSRANAAALGLAPELGEQLMLTLIHGSLAVQERDLVQTGAQGTGRKVLVIGGHGQMGRWFVRFLSAQGFTVEIADPAPDEVGQVGCVHVADWRTLTLDHELIVVAATLPRTNEILKELSHKPPQGVIFDVGSLKTPLREGLTALAAKGAQVTSIHPMFGPDTELLSGRHVIVIDLGVQAANAAARALFASTMATIVEMELDDHDRLIAYVLGLSHATNLAFFTALANSGEPAPRLATLSSTTFDAQMKVASQVAGENPELYFDIQRLNDHGLDALDALVAAAQRVRALVQADDTAGFRSLMEQGNAYLQARSVLR